MEIQQAYKQKMSAQLNLWAAEIKLLEAQVEKAGAAIRVTRSEALQRLQGQQRAAADKMQELGKASGEAWEQAKSAADKIWADLKADIADVQSKFK